MNICDYKFLKKYLLQRNSNILITENKTIIIMSTLTGVVTKFYEEYNVNTPKKLKIIDAYLTYIFFTGVVQFVYCCLVGTFPFNAFLSGFISSVASFVLAVCLRLQVTDINRILFKFIYFSC